MTNDPMTNEIKHYAIIVAGGSGTRMQAAVPKQFLLLNGLPVLMHTLMAFNNCAAKPELIFGFACRFSYLLAAVVYRASFHYPPPIS